VRPIAYAPASAGALTSAILQKPARLLSTTALTASAPPMNPPQ